MVHGTWYALIVIATCKHISYLVHILSICISLPFQPLYSSLLPDCPVLLNLTVLLSRSSSVLLASHYLIHSCTSSCHRQVSWSTFLSDDTQSTVLPVSLITLTLECTEFVVQCMYNNVSIILMLLRQIKTNFFCLKNLFAVLLRTDYSEKRQKVYYEWWFDVAFFIA